MPYASYVWQLYLLQAARDNPCVREVQSQRWRSHLTLQKLAGRGHATRVRGPSDWIEALHWVGWVGLGLVWVGWAQGSSAVAAKRVSYSTLAGNECRGVRPSLRLSARDVALKLAPPHAPLLPLAPSARCASRAHLPSPSSWRAGQSPEKKTLSDAQRRCRQVASRRRRDQGTMACMTNRNNEAREHARAGLWGRRPRRSSRLAPPHCCTWSCRACCRCVAHSWTPKLTACMNPGTGNHEK